MQTKLAGKSSRQSKTSQAFYGGYGYLPQKMLYCMLLIRQDRQMSFERSTMVWTEYLPLIALVHMKRLRGGGESIYCLLLDPFAARLYQPEITKNIQKQS